MEFNLLLQKSEPELQRQLANLREQLRSRRFKVSQGQHKDVREIREMKHDIAQILTRLRQMTTTAKQRPAHPPSQTLRRASPTQPKPSRVNQQS